MSWLLLAVTFLPLVTALCLMAIPREEEGLHRGVGFTVSLVVFLLSLGFLSGFKPAEWNFVVDKPWVDNLGIHFKLALDGISLWLVLLTTFLMPIVFASAWNAVQKKVREFVITLLILETGMIGAFVAVDLFTFYVFWEVMLIPMYFLIGIWGGDRRLYASIKFVLYTMVGSLLMIVAILYLATKYHDATGAWSFDYDTLRRVVLSPREQLLCFIGFSAAFLIKVPLFPLHTWLPDAHVEAPTAGSVLLASVMLKFGGYGMLRFAMPLFPDGLAQAAPLLTVLAVCGVIYGSLVAWAQTDVKKLIAYSSVAHLGMVVLGLMAWNGRGVDGAMMTMLAHGISTGGLFLCIGVIYERRHTRRIDEFGGLWAQMPRFATVFLIITLASIGLPGLSGFAGEFLILLGAFDAYRTWGGMPATFGSPSHLGGAGGVVLAIVLGVVLWLWLRSFLTSRLVETNVKAARSSGNKMTREAVAAALALSIFAWLLVRATGAGIPLPWGHPKVLASLAATGVILGAVYMLWMFQKVMFGPNANPKNHKLSDLSAREVALFLPMLAMAFWLGIYPATFLDDIDPAVQRTLTDFRAKFKDAPQANDPARMMAGTPAPIIPAGQAGAPAGQPGAFREMAPLPPEGGAK